MKSKAIDFLEKHQSGEKSSFEDDARYRRENADWLSRSRNVALALIDYMQDNNLSRSDLAQRLGVTHQYVSKILSGKVNFSFKSISIIEQKLSIDCFRAAAEVTR